MTHPTEEQIEAGAKAIKHRQTNATGDAEEWLIPADAKNLDELCDELSRICLGAALSVPVEGEVDQKVKMAIEWLESKPFRSPSDEWAEGVADLLRAFSARPVGVPDGWQLVPKEPTDVMIAAAEDGDAQNEQDALNGKTNRAWHVDDDYRAMLAAAPTPQRKEGWTMEGQERRWWAYGHYNGQDCPKCGRERMMVCTDNDGTERTICEKCNWEPAANSYLSEAFS